MPSTRISKAYREHVTCQDPQCPVGPEERCYDCGKKMRRHAHVTIGSRHHIVNCIACAHRFGAC